MNTILKIEGIDITTISEQRKNTLQSLINYVQSKLATKETVRLNFICTHNSRRSHLSQIWAQALAHFFKIPNVFCYSGGTEVTTVYPAVLETLQESGFSVDTLSEGGNPIYAIKYADNEAPIIAFSKTIASNFNPNSAFAAVMTCSQADTDCPFVLGAEKRIALPYDDPKAFDATPQKSEKYKERSLQIATELYYVFSKLSA